MIILINGVSGSGKNTVAEMIEDIIEIKQKNKNTYALGNADFVKEVARHLFNWDGIKDEKGKKLLIEITRGAYECDKYFWEKETNSKIEAVSIKHSHITNFIITDWRYLSTYEFFKSKYQHIITINIQRDNLKYNYSDTIKQDDNTLKDFDFDIVINNNGTLEELKEECIKKYDEYLMKIKLK